MTDGFAAVVYDLDGTLVTLDVDWDAVKSDAASALRNLGYSPPADLWGMLKLDDSDARATVDAVISSHEREGARSSIRLPAAKLLPHDVPTAICSLNCEAACRTALEVHDLDAHVMAVVGRDSLSTEKPNPEPLLTALDPLGVEPGETVFVGDSRRDAETAERAGTAFRYVSTWLRA